MISDQQSKPFQARRAIEPQGSGIDQVDGGVDLNQPLSPASRLDTAILIGLALILRKLNGKKTPLPPSLQHGLKEAAKAGDGAARATLALW